VPGFSEVSNLKKKNFNFKNILKIKINYLICEVAGWQSSTRGFF
jgi:hypothetical protein